MRYVRGGAERGAVALLTTIIISILLTIITTGLVALMVSELRQSNDAEQSVRAYYSAQSGVEDGVRKVIGALGSPKVDQLCGTAASQNTNLDTAAPGTVGWTCQQITYSGSPSGSLPVSDKAVQVDVGNPTAPPFRSMKLEWDLTPRPPAGYPANFFTAPANFPAGGAGWPYAAAIEMAIIDYPAGSFSASAAGAISLRNVLAIPRVAATASIDYGAIRGNNPVPGACSAAAASYHCSLIIRNVPSSAARAYMFRLRSRYVGTDYKLTFYTGPNGNGAVVNVPDGTATIDITAKAGDVFRRVIYKVPYRAGAASGLDYVIYSSGDICKNFAIINGALQPGTIGCPYN